MSFRMLSHLVKFLSPVADYSNEGKVILEDVCYRMCFLKGNISGLCDVNVVAVI